MQPALTQVPPKAPCSAMRTRAPSWAATRAARTPPEPAPMTNKSHCGMESAARTAREGGAALQRYCSVGAACRGASSVSCGGHGARHGIQRIQRW